MTPSLESLGIDKLSIDERVELFHAIWDSIATESTTPKLSPELIDELDRRVAEHEADPSSGVAWKDVEAKILAKRSRRR